MLRLWIRFYEKDIRLAGKPHERGGNWRLVFGFCFFFGAGLA